MNKKLITGLVLAIVFVSGAFYSAQADRGDRERGEVIFDASTL